MDTGVGDANALHELRATALHEAGHAVVGHRLGMRLVGVDILAIDDRRGIARWHIDDEDLDRFAYDDIDALAAAFGAATWAGLLAQEMAGYPDDGGFGRPLDGGFEAVPGSDWAGLLELSSRVAPPDGDLSPTLKAWMRLAADVLRTRWPEVEAVAEHLLKSGAPHRGRGSGRDRDFDPNVSRCASEGRQRRRARSC